MGYNYYSKQTTYNLSRSVGRSVKYIVVHYTGAPGSAKNCCQYFSTGNRSASADFFIEKDGAIWQFNPDMKNYYTWHCGDGHGAYGITNANSVGIEVCSSGEDYTSAQINALTSLVAELRTTFNVSANNVVRHYDASRKQCPMPYSGSAAKDAKWKTLHAQITGGKITYSEGWVKGTGANSNKWWYRYADGSYAKSCWKKIKDVWYWFDDKGWAAQSQWVCLEKTGDSWKVVADDKAANAFWYYFDSKCHMVAGTCLQLNSKWYIFDVDGKMLRNVEFNDNGSVKF